LRGAEGDRGNLYFTNVRDCFASLAMTQSANILSKTVLHITRKKITAKQANTGIDVDEQA